MFLPLLVLTFVFRQLSGIVFAFGLLVDDDRKKILVSVLLIFVNR